MRETVDAKARRYLIEARVRVLHCDENAGIIEAEVRGDSRLYSTGRDAEGGIAPARLGRGTARTSALCGW